MDPPYTPEKPVGDRSDGRQESQAFGLGLAMRLGTELVVATMIGVGIGYGLDRWLGTQPWLLLLFLLLGSVAGFKNVYRMVHPVVDQKSGHDGP